MNSLNKIILTDITDIVTVPSYKGRNVKMINRERYGISFCISGQITYIQNNKKYISDSNHAVILPKGQSYTIKGDKDGFFPVINFECTDFLCNNITVIPINNCDYFIKNYEQMKSLFLSKRNRPKIFSIMYNIIYKLSLQSNCSGILLPAIKYIENNYHNPNLTNTILAGECKISEVYFRKLFRETYKMSPKQFIIDMRINKAKQLLTDGILKINAISENSGFSNPYHFCRLFKEKTGLTPTQYMEENKIYKI